VTGRAAPARHVRARWLRGAVAAVALLGALGACAGGDDGGRSDDASGPGAREADEGIAGVLAIRVASNDHTQGKVDYDRHPPAGGDHNPVPAPCGFYQQQIADEYVVHTLEHGAVWLAYSPDLPAADLDVVKAEADDNEDVIATPYAGLDDGVAVVASSWGRQLALDSVSDPRLDQFVQKYRNSKQSPEAAVECPRLPEGEG
jgi:hypothetical protein